MAKPKDDSIKIDGKKEASSLLLALDPDTRERILQGIAVKDPTLASTLRKGMIGFPGILALPSSILQKIIRSFPQGLIALSLRGLPTDQESLFFSKVPERQGRAILEERAAMGPQKLSDVKAARETLIAKALELHQSGEIDLFHQPRI